MFFYAIDLPTMVYQCKPQIDKIANELTVKTDPGHDAKAQKFKKAVSEHNDSEINAILEESLKQYLHASILLAGMRNFCKRYIIQADIDNLNLLDCMLLIYNNRKKIKNQIEK